MLNLSDFPFDIFQFEFNLLRGNRPIKNQISDIEAKNIRTRVL